MNRNHFLFYLLTVFIFWRCAAIAPPSGGPKDTTPPELISANPPNETVRLLDETIELQFSEYMDEKSFTNGIRFSPFFNNEHSVAFKGSRVLITFPEGVKNEMTVVMTISRDVKDEHGVEMATSVQLAYSTGDKIDRGVISGKAFGALSSAVYLFHDDNTDSTVLGRPNYVAETNDNGSFKFDYLAPGKYKILAIERGAVGANLDIQRMMYGVTQTEHILLDSSISDIAIRLFKEKQPLRLLRADWKDQHWGELVFNNALKEGSVISSITIDDHPLKWYSHPEDSSIIILETADTLENGKKEITIGSIAINERTIMDPLAISVSIPAERDTNYVTIQLPNKKTSITPDKDGPHLDIQFSKPQSGHLEHYQLELVKDDSIKVEINKQIKMPMNISIVPKEGWKPKQKYSLSVVNDNDQQTQKTLKDSIIFFEIQTTREQGYGGIIGWANKRNSERLISELNSVENPKWNFKSVVNSDGQFKYVEIPEGKYTLLIFEDTDNNSRYSYGKAFPYEPSEWFYFSPDTIEVRANWDIEISPFNLEDK